MLLTGPVGAGKSTVAVVLGSQLREVGCAAAVIDLDEVYCMARQGDGFGDGDTWRLARCGAAALADSLFSNGMDAVIVEGGFFDEEECAELTKRVAATSRVILVALEVSFDRVWDRVCADPSPGRVASRDALFLRQLHTDFVRALPYLSSAGMCFDGNERGPEELAGAIASAVLGVVG